MTQFPSYPEGASDALDRIWDIVHTPSKATNHRSAERHFMADFDAIRQIIKDARSLTVAQAKPDPARIEACRFLIHEICGDELNGGLIRDVCFTVWSICHNPTHADGNADWGSDTFPTVQKAVALVREKLIWGSQLPSTNCGSGE